ncbi:MAG: hypothetical protein LBB56_00780, partial [Chitinispirillales bacterium]|nr:hypothetical protein [Chitinispirillales bacterium]
MFGEVVYSPFEVNHTVSDLKALAKTLKSLDGEVNNICETLSIFAKEMKRLAESLPEYLVATSFFGVGDILAPKIIAEVGDIRNYPKKSSTVRFA